MMNSYVFTYHGAEVKCVHRSMADMVALDQALASVGFRCIGLPWDTDSNPKVEANSADKDRPRIQVVDAFISIQPYRIRILKIQHLLLFQVSKFFSKKGTNIFVVFYLASNALTRSSNSLFALIKYGINPM